MTMTLDSFYETLSDLGLEWSIGDCNEIRCEAGDCPLIAVHRAKFKDMSINNGNWAKAASDLNLTLDTADDILDAADSQYSSRRTELLTACGFDA